MLLERQTVDNELKILSLFPFIVRTLAQGDLVPIMGKVVGLFQEIGEALHVPTLLWLATHVQRDLTASQVVLNCNWCASSFKEDQPVKTLRICSEVFICHRVAYLGYFCNLDEFWKVAKLLVV